jgi:hypothetical protein
MLSLCRRRAALADEVAGGGVRGAGGGVQLRGAAPNELRLREGVCFQSHVGACKLDEELLARVETKRAAVEEMDGHRRNLHSIKDYFREIEQ